MTRRPETIGLDADQVARFLINSWEGAIIRMKIANSRQPPDDLCSVTFPLFTRPVNPGVSVSRPQPSGAFRGRPAPLIEGRATPVDQAGLSFLREASARTTSVGEAPIANTDLRRRSTLTEGSPDSIFATRD